ncbi:SAM-dependent methyltransferase [Cumulibacter manganitolerans]|uniref:SAM-dependent methyltransferase n=1 Tax=Cumulibacter manganitolerans TaxID=1884992 RepID=UPI001295FE20|nr:cyclopropane-fatty-acyl-phospholipid synthase family protein [Cumulibacter manganitolerans]
MVPVPDAQQLGATPLAGARAALARRLLPTVLNRFDVDIRTAGAPPLRTTAPAPGLPQIDVHRPDDLIRRIADAPKIGIGEGYMAGDWSEADGTDLADVLAPFAEKLSSAIPPVLRRLRKVVDRPIPLHMRNSTAGSRRNIEAHYDLSNDLFALFLDQTMSYSSALFEHGRPRTRETLRAAQLRKIDAALDRARITEASSVLEIGTGWGALAIRAAQRGAKVTTITLSKEQAKLARDRARDAGVSDSIDIRLQDYREVTGLYDAVVSIEMIEAVGEEYWPIYFQTIDAHLNVGGTAVIQAILMDDARLRATRASYSWIQKHIFPGGIIPSLPAIERTLDRHTTLELTEISKFGQSYADTLRIWRAGFDARLDEVRALGWDDQMIRAWQFYLAYSEAGFRTGYLDVAQLRLERPRADADV